MKVIADRDICIGAGMCALTAPAVFDHDDDGIVTPLLTVVDAGEADATRRAVSFCPSQPNR